MYSLEYKELYGARYTSGWMLFRKISATHPNIHCSTNFWLFASNTQRTVNSISKWNTVWNAWSKTLNQVRCNESTIPTHSRCYYNDDGFIFVMVSQSISRRVSNVFWPPMPIWRTIAATSRTVVAARSTASATAATKPACIPSFWKCPRNTWLNNWPGLIRYIIFCV